MNEKVIDLSKWPQGVTLDVTFNCSASVPPFLIFIASGDETVTYYYREINTNRVQINLPKHSPHIKLFSYYPVKTVLIGPIRIDKVKYQFNDKIIVPRDYAFKDIRTEFLPFIPQQKEINGQIVEIPVPSDQPARFLPSIGLKQISTMVMDKYPEPVGEFIIDHEDGHYYYARPLPTQDQWKLYPEFMQQTFWDILQEDEEEADGYAIAQMINKGYNLSGALAAITDYLSDNYISTERMKKAYQKLAAYNKNIQPWTV